MKKNILFVCKHNVFRSKVAEAFFNKYNKNPNNKAKSAGLIGGLLPLSKKEVAGAKKFGIKLAGKPKSLTSDLILWQNVIIVVADNVPKSIFQENKNHGKDLIVWKIEDNHDGNEKEIERIIESIEKRVENLVENLK